MALFDAFLKIDGIVGESADSKHKGEIEILSFSWSEAQTGTHHAGGGGGAGKVAMQDLHVTKKVDVASPKLMLGCATGRHFPKATLICRKAGTNQQEFLKYTLSDVLVSSYQTGGHSTGDTIPVDQVSLNFAKVEIEYKEQLSTGALGGTVKAGWNLKENKAV